VTYVATVQCTIFSSANHMHTNVTCYRGSLIGPTGARAFCKSAPSRTKQNHVKRPRTQTMCRNFTNLVICCIKIY